MSERVWTIIGSGFGLYGYLPAIVLSTDDLVILPSRYKSVLVARPELKFTLPRISWVENDSRIYNSANSVVLAVPPAVQCRKALQLAVYPNIKYFVLEKPVAPTPESAADVLAIMKKYKKTVRIGYSLLHTKWSDRILIRSISGMEFLAMNWFFQAHHYAENVNTWKKAHSNGGGPIRFYGIHLIALASALGYKSVKKSLLYGPSSDFLWAWEATFLGDGIPPLHISVNSNCKKNQFEIVGKNKSSLNRIVKLRSPFEAESTIYSDPRVPALMCLLNCFETDNSLKNGEYDAVNLLWNQVEKVTVTEIRLPESWK